MAIKMNMPSQVHISTQRQRTQTRPVKQDNEEAAPKLIRHLKEELARLRAVLSDSTARAVTDTVNSARPETLVQLMTINEARSRELTEDWLLRWRNEPDESAVSEHVCRVRLAAIAHAQN